MNDKRKRAPAGTMYSLIERMDYKIAEQELLRVRAEKKPRSGKR